MGTLISVSEDFGMRLEFNVRTSKWWRKQGNAERLFARRCGVAQAAGGIHSNHSLSIIINGYKEQRCKLRVFPWVAMMDVDFGTGHNLSAY
jgi:hypothetical protein